MATFRDSNQESVVPYHRTTCVYDVSTPDVVVGWLERCIIDHRNRRDRKVRIFYGDTEKGDFEKIHGREPDPGLDWGEEFGVYGVISRSTGERPIPLLIKTSRSRVGCSIMDGCIVRMIVDGAEVYRHPNYHSPFDYAEIKASEMAPEYSHAVIVNEQEHARFKSESSARKWLAFMRGERMGK